MRLVDIDDFAVSRTNGRSAVMKVLEKYESENPLKEIRFKNSDYNIMICKNGETVISRKD